MGKTVKSPISVIVVEDYKLALEGLCLVLSESSEIKVIGGAESGEKALELIKKHRPDLVIIDLGLPGMDGIDLTGHIKALDETIQVVILTSHENPDEVLAGLSAGANAYCIKGIEPEKLISVIHDVHLGAAWLDPVIAQVGLDIFSQTVSPSSANKPEKWQVNLTERDITILRLLAEGKSNSQIGEHLCVSVHTAKVYIYQLLEKMRVTDRVQAAVKAVKAGLV